MSKVTKVLGAPDSSPYTSHGEWQYSSPQKLGGFVDFRAGTEGHEHLTSGVTYIQTSSHEQRTRLASAPEPPTASSAAHTPATAATG
ncbi:MAG TPA: hypothetical protein VK272_00505 [Solirubrobacteraceae bacterium]|nr:hypothetical protein [Solirubrobacteraceae bacterium]